MGKSKLIKGQCPHCESDLIIELNQDDKGVITQEVSVTKAGKKIADPDDPSAKKDDSWFF